jgi:hypothetical protein
VVPVRLRITEQAITSDTSPHSAREVGDGGWELSWLPGRILGRDQAISGMTLAETVASGVRPGDSRWPLLDVLAAELGLSGPDALARASTGLDDLGDSPPAGATGAASPTAADTSHLHEQPDESWAQEL